jgi:hypothetical protein
MDFSLTEKQIKQANKFIKAQNKKMPLDPHGFGRIGGAYTYHFTPTSIGTVVIIENTATKDILNITDYDSW